MTLLVKLETGIGATYTDVTGRVIHGSLDVTQNAEEGGVAMSSIQFDDPLGNFDVVGWRRILIWETDAAEGFQLVGGFWTADRTVSRKGTDLDYSTTVARVWTVSMADSNELLQMRIMNGTDANRPAETDVARMTWLLATAEMNRISVYTYNSSASPVSMDAVDYRGQRCADIVDDCAQTSGKNYYVYTHDPGAQGATSGIWYGSAGLTVNDSTLLISNVAADIDSTTTFAMSDDTTLNRDPKRVYSGVLLQYDGASLYQERLATSNMFTRRDAAMPAENVKTAGKAAARATRYLRDMSTEEDTITTALLLPSTAVNRIREGQRIQFKASHLPGYEAFVWLRCLTRKVKQVEENYLVTLELSADNAVAAAGATGVLRQSYGPWDNVVYWTFEGSTPQAGYPVETTTGLITAIVDATPPDAARTYTGWLIGGTGTVDVTFFGSSIGVLLDNIVYGITYSIRKNGVIVASESHNASGHLTGYSGSELVVATGVAVVPGDVIEAYVVCVPPTMPFFQMPAFLGQNGERLQITGGTLV